MYETGNQKDRDKKRVVLRDPRRQRGRDAARGMAQCAECTGCRYRIRGSVPCHRTRCRTRRINLNIVVKYTQRPAGRCCFYRRFVCFNTINLYSANDSHVYQSYNGSDIYSFFELQAVLECFADSSIDLVVSMRIRGKSDGIRYIYFGKTSGKYLRSDCISLIRR